MSSLIPVVLSGGSGTRLWPLSRRRSPKQFQKVLGATTMLRQTLDRLSHLEARPLILANVSQVALLQEQLAGDGPTTIVAEPVARNTAPAIAVAALLSREEDTLVVMPADHHITDTEAFARALETAVTAAETGRLVTFGIVAVKPETGYGYILPASVEAGTPAPIERFVEKPSQNEAISLIGAGAMWNSGMFVFPVAVLLEELERLQPDLLSSVRASLQSAEQTEDGWRIGPEFATAPAISIDKAVMEHTSRGAVVPLQAGWSDIGSWETLWELGGKDREDNVVIGTALVVDSQGSYVRSEGPIVVVAGVDDLVVVATDDAVLVTRRSAAQDVRKLVERLGEEHL